MRFRLALLSAATAAVLSSPALAQVVADPDATAQGDVSVTIYNSGLGLVQDIRQLNIGSGRSTISFPDVSAQIRPETLSFAAADTGIVEQNFDFDLLTPEKLMEKAIGQTVTLVRTNPATGQETRERATVLSTAGGVVIQVGDRIEVLRDDGLPVRVIFDRVPPNLRARPTLSVTVESGRNGTRPASIRYLTPGLGWSSDYVALYDEAKGTIDMYGEGISKIGEILDLGVKAGLVEKSGSWLSYDSIRIGQGRENAKEYLRDNPEVCDRLEAAIRGRTDQVAEEMMAGPDADDDN